MGILDCVGPRCLRLPAASPAPWARARLPRSRGSRGRPAEAGGIERPAETAGPAAAAYISCDHARGPQLVEPCRAPSPLILAMPCALSCCRAENNRFQQQRSAGAARVLGRTRGAGPGCAALPSSYLSCSPYDAVHPDPPLAADAVHQPHLGRRHRQRGRLPPQVPTPMRGFLGSAPCPQQPTQGLPCAPWRQRRAAWPWPRSFLRTMSRPCCGSVAGVRCGAVHGPAEGGRAAAAGRCCCRATAAAAVRCAAELLRAGGPRGRRRASRGGHGGRRWLWRLVGRPGGF
jgi:hypothetical protein